MARILLADEDREALARCAERLRGMGHEVVDLAVGVEEAADRAAEDDPDASIVVVHRDEDHALALIGEIAAYARGPVIAMGQDDEAFVREAAERGVTALARGAEDLGAQLELALARHAEVKALGEQVQRLEGAIERRAVIERAKGVLMERHGVGEREAFELLRRQARSGGRKVADLAQAVLDGHALLPARRRDDPHVA
jgi:AmiR/NasT family two-component response regulator